MKAHPPDELRPVAKNIEVQVLRAVAVLAVVAYHLVPEIVPGGFVGVDAFFVISGWVITLSIIRMKKTGFLAFLGDFFSRRILRLGPALIVMVLASSILATLFIPPGFDLGDDIYRTGFASLFGLGNFALFWSGREYISSRLEFNLFTHTWSLGVEEQFYLLLPLILWIGGYGANRVSNVLASQEARRISLIFLIFLTGLSFFWATWSFRNDPLSAFYLLPSRFWELALGVLIALVVRGETHQKVALGHWAASRLPRTFGYLILLSTFFLGGHGDRAFTTITLAVLGASLIVAFQPPNPTRVVKPPSIVRRLLVMVGDASYSVYLWHWPIIVLFKWTVGLSEIEHYLLALATTGFCTFLSYRLIETPFRKPTNSPRKRVRSLVGVLTIGLVVASLNWAGHRDYLSVFSLSVTKNGSLFAYDREFSPPVEFGGRIWLVGNSHARHLIPVVSALDSEYVFLRPECRLEGLLPSADCSDFAESVKMILNRAAPGDIVIFSWLQIPRQSEITGGKREDWIVEKEFEDLRERLESPQSRAAEKLLLAKFRARDIHVVFPTPTPVFDAPIFRCLDWWNSSNSICDADFRMMREDLDRYSEPVIGSLKILESESLVRIWETSSAFCDNTVCRADLDDVWLFTDGDHLSVAGNQVLIPSLLRTLAVFPSP